MKGLAPHTAELFDAISRLECIKPFVLVGGTALSLQIDHRESEDLDFMNWRTSRNEKREVDWPMIKKELETIGVIQHCEILDFDHVEFILEGVKLSFYANPHHSPLKERLHCINNIFLADKTAIGAMKLEVMLRRSKFRDYYDIYCLLNDGVSLTEMIELALKYSDHRLKSKNLLAMISRPDRFVPDSNFSALKPRFAVTAKEISERIISILDSNR